MKVIALVMFLFAAFTSAPAQNPFGPLPSACGPKGTTFDVKLDKSQHSLTEPERGKARIYFIYDSGLATGDRTLVMPMMLGMDGAWVGVDHNNSYFSVSIDPGEHHICAASQYYRESKLVALSHLQAEAGNTYFYRARFVVSVDSIYLELRPVDSDEGKYLIASYPLSVFRSKK